MKHCLGQLEAAYRVVLKDMVRDAYHTGGIACPKPMPNNTSEPAGAVAWQSMTSRLHYANIHCQ